MTTDYNQILARDDYKRMTGSLKEKVERTVYFSFTNKNGEETTLTARRGIRQTPGKARAFQYWQCQINVEGRQLDHNIVSSQGPVSDEEGVIYLKGEQPVFYCNATDGTRLAIVIPADIATLVHDFVNSEIGD